MTIIKGTVKIKVATVLPDEADNKDADFIQSHEYGISRRQFMNKEDQGLFRPN